MKTRDFLMSNEIRYPTGSLVIPQICGIHQSWPHKNHPTLGYFSKIQLPPVDSPETK